MEVDSVVVLLPAGPGREARWVAHVLRLRLRRTIVVVLADGFALGLAVLNGRTHVAFGESSGGSLRPGDRSTFRSGRCAVASAGRYGICRDGTRAHCLTAGAREWQVGNTSSMFLTERIID